MGKFANAADWNQGGHKYREESVRALLNESGHTTVFTAAIGVTGLAVQS